MTSREKIAEVRRQRDEVSAALDTLPVAMLGTPEHVALCEDVRYLNGWLERLTGGG